MLNKLCTCASQSGNLLLNVGPKPDGTFPEPCVKLLNEIGGWMKAHGEGIYGSLPMKQRLNYHLATQNRNTVYVHFRWGTNLHWPSWGPYWIHGVERKVVKAWIPATGETIPFEWREGRVCITVPQEFPEPFGTVALRLES